MTLMTLTSLELVFFHLTRESHSCENLMLQDLKLVNAFLQLSIHFLPLNPRKQPSHRPLQILPQPCILCPMVHPPETLQNTTYLLQFLDLLNELTTSLSID